MATLRPPAGDREAIIYEFHDLVLNRLSAMSVQIMAARVAPSETPEALRRLDRLVGEAAHAERILGTLLAPAQEVTPALRGSTVWTPSEAADSVRAAMRGVGSKLRLTVEESVDAVDLATRNGVVSTILGLAEHVERHAPRGSGSRLDVDADPERATIAFRTPPPSEASPLPPLDSATMSGFIERVTLLGGSLDLQVNAVVGTWHLDVAFHRHGTPGPGR